MYTVRGAKLKFLEIEFMARLLIDAILSGDETLAFTLIQTGMYGCIDSQTARRDGTALFFCCSRGFYNLALHLIAMGANVNSQTKSLSCPLHAAADRGYVNIVELLIEKGANVNAKNHRGDTPLHLAAYRGHGDVIYCLLQHGADLLALNCHQVKAQNEARGQGHKELADFLLRKEKALSLSMTDDDSPPSMLILNPPKDSPTSDLNSYEDSYPLTTSDSSRHCSHTYSYDSKTEHSQEISRKETSWHLGIPSPRRPSLCSTGSDSTGSEVGQIQSEGRRESVDCLTPASSPVPDSTQRSQGLISGQHSLNCQLSSNSQLISNSRLPNSLMSSNSRLSSSSRMSSNSRPLSSMSQSSSYGQHSSNGYASMNSPQNSVTSSSGHFSDSRSGSPSSLLSWTPSSMDLFSTQSTKSSNVRSPVTLPTFEKIPDNREQNNLSTTSSPRKMIRAFSLQKQSSQTLPPQFTPRRSISTSQGVEPFVNFDPEAVSFEPMSMTSQTSEEPVSINDLSSIGSSLHSSRDMTCVNIPLT